MATAAPCYTLLGGFERSASDDAPPSQSSQPADHHAQRTLFWCDGTLHQLLTERSFHDVIMNTDNGVTVKGHKFIMATRSIHFRDKFYRSGDKLEENCKVRTYNFSGTSVVLHLIMEWLYTGAIGELEASGGFIDDQRVQLWVQLLKESVNKQLGGLDLYVRALLVRSSTTQHHVAASLLSLALQQEEPMMDVAQAMVRVLQKLPFADDCLKNTLEQDLEVLLDAVPFQTNEVTICKALAYWRKAENLDSEDDFDDEPEKHYLPQRIVELIDITALSYDDVELTVEPLKILDETTLTRAWQLLAVSDGSPTESRPSTLRGARYKWTEPRELPLCDDPETHKIIVELQSYTTLSAQATDLSSLSTNKRSVGAINE